MSKVKKFTVDAYGDAAYAVFEIKEELAHRIVRLANLMATENLNKVEALLPLGSVEFYASDWFNAATEDQEEEKTESRIVSEMPLVAIYESYFCMVAYHSKNEARMASEGIPVSTLIEHFNI